MLTPAYGLTATERILPAMAMDFTSAVLDARVSLTRANATATRTNSSGYIETVAADTARFDFDPLTLACRGLLIEETRANLLIQSENFPTWSAATTTATLTSGTSPANTNTANKLAPTVGSNTTLSYIIKGVTKAASAITYTYSVYLKAAEFTQALLMMHGSSTANRVQAIVTLTNGSLSGGAAFGTFTNYSGVSESLGNNWWRVSITGTSNTDTIVSVRLYPYLAAGTGDGTSGILAWGTQLEAGAFSTSYIPTTTASLQRNADVAVMTGTNFSSWWAATSGAVAAQAQQISVTGTCPWIQFDDTSADNIIALRGNTTNPELYIKATTDQAQIDAGTIAAKTIYGLGAGWTTDNCAASVSGGASITDESATIPTVIQARLGSDGANYLNGWLRSVRYWKQRVTNAEVQAFSKL